MADHALTIGALRTDCTVLADPGEAAGLRGRLDRAVSERLPRLLADLAEPILDGYDGVIRLRSLRLDLSLTGPFDEREIARLIASRIAAALRTALSGAGQDVRTWETHQAYMASYIEKRLGLAHEPDWAFLDFSALELLSPSEAAFEIVKARPEVLRALAIHGRAQGAPDRVLVRFDDRRCAEIFDAVLRRQRRSGDQALRTWLVSMAEQIAAGVAGPEGEAPARTALALTMRTAATAQAAELALLSQAAIVAVDLARLVRAFEERTGRPMTARDLEAVVVDPSRVHLAEPLHPAFVGAVGDRLVRATVVDLLPRLRPRRVPDAASERDATDRQARPRRSPPRSLFSPVAGLALLLPEIVAIGAHRYLTPSALRRAALSTLPDEARRGAETDPLLAALFPADPHDSDEVPPVLPTMLALVAPESRGLADRLDGAHGWGNLMLARFASRLPGLRASSRGYLQRQFFLVSGKLDMNDETLTVTLDGPPLAVVLQMAGLSGAQMAIPHLADRVLVLVLRGLR